METLETAQLQERGATAERSSPGLCPSLCRLLEQNTTDWELRNDGNVSLTVVESGRPRSKSQHSQVLLRTLWQASDFSLCPQVAEWAGELCALFIRPLTPPS